MLELHKFLNEIKTSPEFKATVFRAAVAIGYEPKTNDETAAEELNRRVSTLLAEILFELTDEKYANRTHGKRKLYDEGCRGPLCTKDERDRSRRRYQRANPNSGRNRRRSELDDTILNYVLKRYEERPALGGAA